MDNQKRIASILSRLNKMVERSDSEGTVEVNILSISNDVNWLTQIIEQLQEENGAMAEKHAEKDMVIAEFKEIIEQQKKRIKELEDHAIDLNETVFTHAMNEERLLDQNKKFRKRIFELRAKTGYRVYEENLALHQQIEWYKEMLKGGNESEQCQTSHSMS